MKPPYPRPRPHLFLVWTLCLLCLPLVSPKPNFLTELTSNNMNPNHSRTLFNEVHKLLSPNTPFYSVIKPGESHYFEVLLLPNDPSITISIQSDSNNIDLYISTDPNNKYPDPNSFTYTTKASITLTSKDREKACGTSESLGCSVYINAISTGDQEETPYLISIRRDSSSESTNSATALEDGREIRGNIPENSDIPVVFYYTPGQSQNSIVTVRSPGREILIYARRIKVDIASLAKPDIAALDEDTAEFSSLEDQDNHAGVALVSVPPLADSDLTIVAVSVYFNEIQKESNDTTTTFTIIASSQINHLFTGTPYSGFVAKDHYAYFLIPVMRSEGVLLVSLTNLDDGDADLVLSFGQNARPTISGNQFASISQERTEIIEVDARSGNWVLGVYGKNASSFTLAAVYEDYKMVDLKLGTPVSMPLNKPSSVTFKFLHKSKTNIQVELGTRVWNSKGLSLYMTCLNATQNLAVNLPDSAHYKWNTSLPDGGSGVSIRIRAKETEACISGLYFITIEAKYRNEFVLVVREEEDKPELPEFRPMRDGFPYSGQLKPQESSPFRFRSSSETDEAQLKVETLGSELEILMSTDPTINLTNFVWKEKIPSGTKNYIISLKKGRDINVLYILFYNPSNMSLSYNFTVGRKSSKTIPIQGGVQKVDINPFEKISFLHYSNRNDGEIPINITLNGYFTEKIESALKEGNLIRIQYWPEETSGPGQEISFEKSVPEINERDVSQMLLMKSSIGKYLIEIVNPWEFTYTFSIKMGSDLQLLGENLQSKDEFGFDQEKTYEIFMTKTSAKWYFWLYSCYASVDLGIGKENSVTIPKEGSYMHREIIGESEIRERFRDVTVSSKKGMAWYRFFMYSTLFNETKFYDYEVKPFIASFVEKKKFV